MTIRVAREALSLGSVEPGTLAKHALQCANRNTGKNTYIWRDPDWTMEEAARAAAMSHLPGGRFGDRADQQHQLLQRGNGRAVEGGSPRS